jgi:peptide/nickel transport system substrate-binding protein
MAWGDAVMMSPASVANNKTNPVGTGPFQIQGMGQGRQGRA